MIDWGQNSLMQAITMLPGKLLEVIYGDHLCPEDLSFREWLNLCQSMGLRRPASCFFLSFFWFHYYQQPGNWLLTHHVLTVMTSPTCLLPCMQAPAKHNHSGCIRFQEMLHARTMFPCIYWQPLWMSASYKLSFHTSPNSACSVLFLKYQDAEMKSLYICALLTLTQQKIPNWKRSPKTFGISQTQCFHNLSLKKGEIASGKAALESDQSSSRNHKILIADVVVLVGIDSWEPWYQYHPAHWAGNHLIKYKCCTW